jgi:hypothetical protein
VGVFASRSTHRPNPLGLSLVELTAVECDDGVRLRLAGADLLDGTPVVDIKPYVPFIEARPEARGGFISGPPPQLRVEWDAGALRQLAGLDAPPDFALLVEQVLAQDPRPAYQNDADRVYGVSLYCYNVRFNIRGEIARVLEILQ